MVLSASRIQDTETLNMNAGDKDFLIEFLNVSDHEERAFLITIATAFLKERSLEERKNFFRKLVEIMSLATCSEYESTFFAMKQLIHEMRKQPDMEETLEVFRVELEFSVFRGNSPEHYRDIQTLRNGLSMKLSLARNRFAA